MSHTSVICLLPFMLALISNTQGQGQRLPPFFPSSDDNDGRDAPMRSDFPDLPLPGRDDEWSHFQHLGNQLKSKEDGFSVKAASFASKRTVISELLYDLEVVACPATKTPSPGQMVCYETWVHENNQGAIRCWSRQVSSGNIPSSPGTYGTLYTIRSENFGMRPYHPRRLQYFKIKCPGDGMITSMTTDLEGEVSLTIANKTQKYCVDYVNVKYEDSRSSCQLCGKQTVQSKSCEREFEGSILVTFRTSHLESHFKGFDMNVVCYDASEQDLPGCIPTLSAEKEKAMTNNENSYSYQTQKFLPANAETQLMNFYKNNAHTDTAFSAEDSYEMLRMALLSQNSCNAVLRAIGRGVSQMFPTSMVMQAKMNGWEYE